MKQKLMCPCCSNKLHFTVVGQAPVTGLIVNGEGQLAGFADSNIGPDTRDIKELKCNNCGTFEPYTNFVVEEQPDISGMQADYHCPDCGGALNGEWPKFARDGKPSIGIAVWVCETAGCRIVWRLLLLNKDPSKKPVIASIGPASLGELKGLAGL